VKRIGVISDTHLRSRNARLPDAVLRTFEGMDLIIHAGDLIVLSVLTQLQKIAPTVAVRGNMDSRDVKATLDERAVTELEGVRIGVTHGWGAPSGLAERILAGEAFKGEKIDLLVFGHSHQPTEGRVGDVYVFNPGSTTSGRPTVGIVEIGPEEIHSSIVVV